MALLDWLRGGREAAQAVEQAGRLAEADDAVPIDEVRAADGEVASAARRLRAALPATPRRMRLQLRLELAGMLRRLGPAERLEADEIYRALRSEEPRRWGTHWDHALLLKHSGRFEEGLAALDAYRETGGADDKAFRWNTGICATGAGKGGRALEVWRSLGFKLQPGDDSLPNGGFPEIQVRISSRGPLCDPTRKPLKGEFGFEYGWARPLSPCHGTLLTPLVLDEPADVGDLLLWDGAPVRHKEFEGRKVATFPLLSVLRRGGFLRFHFRGEQLEPGLVGALQESLPKGTQLYVHDEQVEWLCKTCASSGAPPPHEHGGPPARRRVSGKLAIPPQVDVADVRSRLAEALRVRPSVRLAVPDLHRHIGDLVAADAERALWAELG